MYRPIRNGEKMSAIDTKALEQLFDEYGEAWATLDPAKIAEWHAEDGVFCLHVGDAEDAVGRDAVRETFAGFIAQFPDLGYEVVRVSFGPDHYVAEWKFSGTLRTPLEVGDETAQPTGEWIEWDAVDVITWKDGLIQRKDTYVDSVALQAKLAAAAEKAAA
jgi:uncharacterized protein (TIGR02246 family)